MVERDDYEEFQCRVGTRREGLVVWELGGYLIWHTEIASSWESDLQSCYPFNDHGSLADPTANCPVKEAKGGSTMAIG